MKRLVFFFLLLLSLKSNSQTTDTSLNKRLAEYFQFSKDLEIDKLLDYMYPRIFEIAPRPQMKEAIMNAHHNPDIEKRVDSVGINKVLPLSNFNNGSFTKINYRLKIKITLLNKEMEENTDGVLQGYVFKYGDGNVSYDESTKIFWVYQNKEALAIKDNYSKGVWTILGLEQDNKGIAGIIPAEIKKEYKIQ